MGLKVKGLKVKKSKIREYRADLGLLTFRLFFPAS